MRDTIKAWVRVWHDTFDYTFEYERCSELFHNSWWYSTISMDTVGYCWCFSTVRPECGVIDIPAQSKPYRPPDLIGVLGTWGCSSLQYFYLWNIRPFRPNQPSHTSTNPNSCHLASSHSSKPPPIRFLISRTQPQDFKPSHPSIQPQDDWFF